MKTAAAALALALLACPARADAPPAAPFQTCMNFSNALEAPQEGDWGYRIRHRDIVALAHAGFDAVRIPIRWSAHAEKAAPYAIDPAFFARVDEVVASVIEAGMTAIINVHHYREIMDDPDNHTARLSGMWRQIADHYAAWSDHLIFEVLNEASGNLEAAQTDQINTDVLALIRRNNPDRWVILGTAQWGALWGMLEGVPPPDPRVIASFHYYDPFDFTHQGAGFVDPPLPLGVGWGTEPDRAKVSAHIAEAAAFGHAHNLPVFLGEFGVHRGVPLADRVAWIDHIRKAAERHDIAWCHWGWASEFHAYQLEDNAWIAPIRAALGK